MNSPTDDDSPGFLDREREFLTRFIGGYPTRIKNAEEASLVRERWNTAMQKAEEQLRTSPSSQVRIVMADLLRMGHSMDVPGAAGKCQEILKDVLAAESENVDAHLVMAQFLVCINAAYAPEAEKHFREVERLSTNANPIVYQGLGFACIYQDRITDAITHFEKYLDHVEDPDIRTLLSQLQSGAKPEVVFTPTATRPVADFSFRRSFLKSWIISSFILAVLFVSVNLLSPHGPPFAESLIPCSEGLWG